MTVPEPESDDLIRRSAAGDRDARQALLARHRSRLLRMVTVRLDRRLSARLDPSDVVQEVLVEAHEKLDDYLRRRPIPFYPWLRQIAWQRLVKLHEYHRAQKRGVGREVAGGLGLPETSADELAGRLVTSTTSPSDRLVREELRRQIRDALGRLGERDREVLVLRYLEGLSPGEVAAVLGMSEGAVKTRHARALLRLQALLGQGGGDER